MVTQRKPVTGPKRSTEEPFDPDTEPKHASAPRPGHPFEVPPPPPYPTPRYHDEVPDQTAPQPQ